MTPDDNLQDLAEERGLPVVWLTEDESPTTKIAEEL